MEGDGGTKDGDKGRQCLGEGQSPVDRANHSINTSCIA